MVENLWPLGRILEIKANKKHGLVRRVRLETNLLVLAKNQCVTNRAE